MNMEYYNSMSIWVIFQGWLCIAVLHERQSLVENGLTNENES